MSTPLPKVVMYPRIHQFLQEVTAEALSLPPARKALLSDLAAFIKAYPAHNGLPKLVFICTHNSRRSHFGHIWAATAAAYLGLSGLSTFSGGTEVTAFNPRAVAALERVGFHITHPQGTNPHYLVRYAEGLPPIESFSKVYDDPHNPDQEVIAMMTCAEADQNCPVIPGAIRRVALNYRDPKEADGTAAEAARYDERCRQIATEMFYLMQQIAA